MPEEEKREELTLGEMKLQIKAYRLQTFLNMATTIIGEDERDADLLTKVSGSGITIRNINALRTALVTIHLPKHAFETYIVHDPVSIFNLYSKGILAKMATAKKDELITLMTAPKSSLCRMQMQIDDEFRTITPIVLSDPKSDWYPSDPKIEQECRATIAPSRETVKIFRQIRKLRSKTLIGDAVRLTSREAGMVFTVEEFETKEPTTFTIPWGTEGSDPATFNEGVLVAHWNLFYLLKALPRSLCFNLRFYIVPNMPLKVTVKEDEAENPAWFPSIVYWLAPRREEEKQGWK